MPRSNERPPSATNVPVPSDEPAPAAGAPPVMEPGVPGVARPAPVEVSPPAPTPAPEKSEEIILPPAGGNRPSTDEGVSRTSYRPTYKSVRNILRGRVVSYETGRPEEAVSVVLANRTGGFSERKALTDADGEFKISLPDGDWVVKVTMPSGSVFTVGRDLTASAGRVVDANNRYVGELIITR